jgi:flagellar biogenesis protein FliO
MNNKLPSAAAPAASTAASVPAVTPQAAATQAPATAASGLPLIRPDADAATYGAFGPALGLLLLAAAVALWVLKRNGWQRLKGLAPARDRLLQVRETVHLSPKVRVTYLQCGEHELLLAHSDQSQAWMALPPRSPREPGHGP